MFGYTFLLQLSLRRHNLDTYLSEFFAHSTIVCPANWIGYETHCYFFNTNEANTFLTARGKCEALGAWLVQVETEAENNFIVSYMDSYSGKTHSEFWIDLSSPPGSKSLSSNTKKIISPHIMRGSKIRLILQCVYNVHVAFISGKVVREGCLAPTIHDHFWNKPASVRSSKPNIVLRLFSISQIFHNNSSNVCTVKPHCVSQPGELQKCHT